ncbi:MAG: hypothetical protein M3417_12365 [Actinomycetota bacterium]|nr:hypothetical protein [Actinomycetota bacterium]
MTFLFLAAPIIIVGVGVHLATALHGERGGMVKGRPIGDAARPQMTFEQVLSGFGTALVGICLGLVISGSAFDGFDIALHGMILAFAGASLAYLTARRKGNPDRAELVAGAILPLTVGLIGGLVGLGP